MAKKRDKLDHRIHHPGKPGGSRTARGRGHVSSILTDDLAAMLCRHAAAGLSIERAAQLCHLSRHTVYGWLRRGREGDPDYAPLATAYDAARSTWVSRMHAIVEAGCADDPRLALELLARRCPEDYGRPADRVAARQLEKEASAAADREATASRAAELDGLSDAEVAEQLVGHLQGGGEEEDGA